MADNYVIEMLHITKEFPGIKANDDITLQLRKGEIHALLGENGAGKSTLMSVLFGLYQPEQGTIKKNGKEVKINNPNDANALGIGMVHQHFKLVECFTVLDNIILGVEDTKHGFLQKDEARKKVMALSEKYGLKVDPDALVSDISVGMQQRVEILKMLYRDNEILIFDEPTAVLTPQEIDELMDIMRGFKAEGKSILFITHKLNEIMAVSDRCSVLRKGRYIGTVDIKDTTKEELSKMMVGRDVQFAVDKKPCEVGKPILEVENLVVPSKVHKNNAVRGVSFNVRAGEIVCVAGIDGNGQSELIYGITGLEKPTSGTIRLEAVFVVSRDGRDLGPGCQKGIQKCVPHRRFTVKLFQHDADGAVHRVDVVIHRACDLADDLGTVRACALHNSTAVAAQKQRGAEDQRRHGHAGDQRCRQDYGAGRALHGRASPAARARRSATGDVPLYFLKQ